MTLAALALEGIAPDRVLTRIATSLGLAGPDEAVTTKTLLARFDPARLPREPWVVQG